jgi:hypothetical protein
MKCDGSGSKTQQNKLGLLFESKNKFFFALF